jgi:hypothetical protein
VILCGRVRPLRWHLFRQRISLRFRLRAEIVATCSFRSCAYAHRLKNCPEVGIAFSRSQKNFESQKAAQIVRGSRADG